MKRYIDTTKENREFLMRAFGVTERTLYYALRYDGVRGDSDLAKRIRKAAIERGGVAMVTLPAAEYEGMKR